MEQMVQTLRLLRWGVVVLMVLRMVGKALECTLLLGGGLLVNIHGGINV